MRREAGMAIGSKERRADECVRPYASMITVWPLEPLLPLPQTAWS